MKTRGIKPTDTKNTGDLWVFGYGSLMWRPGFEFLERVPARLIGLHRALCVYSFVHRGTPERPGLVLGLDRGGMCRGIAFRVAGSARIETVAYLRAREQVTTVYLETVRRIELEEPARRQVRALCFIVDRSHVQYAGRLTLAECVHHVRQGHGRSGANRDYVVETVQALEALGYRETDLHLIAERLRSDAAHRKAEVGDQKPEIRTRRSANHAISDFRLPISTPSASLLPAFGDEPGGRLLEDASQPRQECPLVEAGRDRIEHLDQHGAGKAAQRAARPEQPGIERDRHARQPDLAVEIRYAGHVARLGARRAARAFGKDHELTRVARAPARAAAVIRASAATRAPRSIGIMRAFCASQPKSGSHISSRLST